MNRLNNEMQLMEAVVILFIREHISHIEKERILKSLQKDYDKKVQQR